MFWQLKVLCQGLDNAKTKFLTLYLLLRKYNSPKTTRQSFNALQKNSFARAQRLLGKFWAPLALKFSAVLRSRSRSVTKERRSILRSFSPNLLNFYCMKLYFFPFEAVISQTYIQGKKKDSHFLKKSGQNIWILYKYFLKNCMILSTKMSADLRSRSAESVSHSWDFDI